MKHDLAHEEKQNEALKLLAQAIEGVANQCGWLGAKALAMKVEAILAKDEQESDDSAPAVDPTADVPADANAAPVAPTIDVPVDSQPAVDSAATIDAPAPVTE